MLYAILCYHTEDVVGSWSKEQDDAVMAETRGRAGEAAKQGRLGPVARLLPTTAATTLRKDRSAAGRSTGRSRKPRSSCSASISIDCEDLDEAMEPRASSATPIPAAPMRSARSACSIPEGVA